MRRSIVAFNPNPSTGPGTAHKAMARTNQSRRKVRESAAARDASTPRPAARTHSFHLYPLPIIHLDSLISFCSDYCFDYFHLLIFFLSCSISFPFQLLDPLDEFEEFDDEWKRNAKWKEEKKEEKKEENEE